MNVVMDLQTKTMAWGSENFKEPWEKMVGIFARLKKGEKIDRKERLVRFKFLPLPLDAGLIYFLLRYGGTRLLFGKNGSLFTIVTSSDLRKILFASVEYESDGVYLEFHPLTHRLHEKWAMDVADLLKRGDMVSAYYYLKDFVALDPHLSHINIGVLKVANVNFFREFMDAYDRANRGKRLLRYALLAEGAIQRILEEGWIKFYPEVNLSRLLKIVRPFFNAVYPLNRLLSGRGKHQNVI